MRSIAYLSEKGGVGKTTLAINVAVGLARAGQRVLLLDSDPQGNASYVLTEGQGSGTDLSLTDVLLDQADAVDAIRSTHIKGLDLLPSAPSLADANVSLSTELGRERRLRLAMEPVEDTYDWVVCDTSPARTLITVNVLNWVQAVYVPVDPGVFALAGVGKTQEAIADVVRYLDNRQLRLAGLILMRMERDNLSRDVEAQLRETFGPLVLTATIPASVKVGEAHGRFQSVMEWAPRSPAARAFEALITEIAADGQREAKRTRKRTVESDAADNAA
jgi:chromosome partitioning protein